MESDLLITAKTGDSEAIAELYARYRPLVYSIKNKYVLKDFDTHDWLQEGLITFYECLLAFDPDFGTTLGAFFKRAFENRIRSFVRKECAYKRKSLRETIPYELSIAEGDQLFMAKSYTMANPLDYVIIREAFHECSQRLTTLEKLAFSQYVLGSSIAEKSPNSLQSAYDRSKRKIRQHLQNPKIDEK